ncbi:MAG: NAD(P)/FAD-dependent oxidoreductase [bacterium]
MTASSSQLVDIIVPLKDSEDREIWRHAVAKKLRKSPGQIKDLRLRKHSIDARKRDIKIRLRLEVSCHAPLPPDTLPTPNYPTLKANAPPAVVVGSGPAGLFAALKLIEQGVKPIVLERGKDASARRFDLAPLLREGRVIEDSNYCFGEGGAGTFSDGKLYTRATKRGPVANVYETFVAHGAPERILVDSHPHIGSNLLPKVVMAMRESIRQAGGDVHFGAKVRKLLIKDQSITGVETADGAVFQAKAVILATGHSARDVYHMLQEHGIVMEAKSFAVGVRIEHPQRLIDAQQYHSNRNDTRHHLLPAASYSLATKIKDRGVHSFCMCPGGFIVPAATENDEVVVNGMSLSRRDSPFANSGLVVSVEPEDTVSWQSTHGVLAGVAYQKQLEQTAKILGGGGQVAPAQRVIDFLEKRLSTELNQTSYFPGLKSAAIHEALPAGISWRMREGLKLFGQQIKGFTREEGQLIGFETRTSSPVRIPRLSDTLEHPQIAGLFPCGEGAGFAGGIVSAALDGMRCATQVAHRLAAPAST